MGSFKDIGDNKSVNSKYSGRAIIYLESQEDYQIFFERWFYDEGEFIEFRSSDSGSGGGCTNVLKNVEDDRRKDISSFGIVDRDALMQQQKWPEFWETDDYHYKLSQPFGKYIYPLCKWEIENYLFDIDEIEILLADIGVDSPRKIRETSKVAEELLDHCDALIPIMAYNVLLHKKGRKAEPIGFCVQDTNRTRIEQRLLKKIDDDEKEEYKNVILKIENFRQNIDDTPENSFIKINRILDGKRLFKRLENHNKLGADYRFLLARKIKEKGKIDSELFEVINGVKELN